MRRHKPPQLLSAGLPALLLAAVTGICAISQTATAANNVVCISPSGPAASIRFPVSTNWSIVTFTRVSGAIRCTPTGPLAPFGCARGSNGVRGLPDSLAMPAIGLLLTDHANTTLLPGPIVRGFVPFTGSGIGEVRVGRLQPVH